MDILPQALKLPKDTQLLICLGPSLALPAHHQKQMAVIQLVCGCARWAVVMGGGRFWG